MQIVSWNMGCAPPMARYRRSHGAAWRLLLDELRPDVCLVQEALVESEAMSAGGRLFWSEPYGSDSGAAVWVRDGLTARPFAIRSEGSCVAGAVVDGPDRERVFLSVHVGPPNYRKHLRVLAESVSVALDSTSFVVAGDLNAARHIDVVYGGKWFKRYFAALEQRGWHDCHWELNQRECQSFWGHQAKNPYQCDHAFVDRASAPWAVTCRIVDSGSVRALSDHGPLLLELAPFPAGRS